MRNGDSTEPVAEAMKNRQSGFTYIGVLVIMSVMLMAMGAASEVWHTVMQQEKEKELIGIGHEFQKAIKQYYVKFGNKYPPSLAALVEVNDLSGKKAHFLRKLYLDPMTGQSDWGVVQGRDGGVAGVYSLSEDKPLKTKGFSDADFGFEDAGKYSEWKFVYQPKMMQGYSAGSIVNGIVRPVPRVK